MKKYATKLTISNTANDNRAVEWYFCDEIDDVTKWISEKNKEEDEWNYKTDGANSIRYYAFDEYLSEDLLEVCINELDGIKIKDLITLINHNEHQ